jgi:hypothetical protein
VWQSYCLVFGVFLWEKYPATCTSITKAIDFAGAIGIYCYLFWPVKKFFLAPWNAECQPQLFFCEGNSVGLCRCRQSFRLFENKGLTILCIHPPVSFGWDLPRIPARGEAVEYSLCLFCTHDGVLTPKVSIAFTLVASTARSSGVLLSGHVLPPPAKHHKVRYCFTTVVKVQAFAWLCEEFCLEPSD